MNNLHLQNTGIELSEREKLKGHSSFVIWFTGLSGSGKSTLAVALAKKMLKEKVHCYMLDGDNVRLGINSDLDFSKQGRKENIRRIAEVSKLFVDAGEIVLSAFVSPYRDDREIARSIVGKEFFVEVFVDTPLDECERRDVKGLYRKARKGEIKDFTGVDAPYEKPESPDIIIETKDNTVEQCIDLLYKKIEDKIRK